MCGMNNITTIELANHRKLVSLSDASDDLTIENKGAISSHGEAYYKSRKARDDIEIARLEKLDVESEAYWDELLDSF